MPDEERPIKWIRVRYGNSIYLARRFDTGTWWIEDQRGRHFMSLNNEKFQAQFEKVPDSAI